MPLPRETGLRKRELAHRCCGNAVDELRPGIPNGRANGFVRRAARRGRKDACRKGCAWGGPVQHRIADVEDPRIRRRFLRDLRTNTGRIANRDADARFQSCTISQSATIFGLAFR